MEKCSRRGCARDRVWPPSPRWERANRSRSSIGLSNRSCTASPSSPRMRTASPTILGGVAFAPDGDPWVSECVFQRHTPAPLRLANVRARHERHLDAASRNRRHHARRLRSDQPPGRVHLFELERRHRTVSTRAPGCRWRGPVPITNPRGLPGNALGITVDPRTGHLIYPGADCHPPLVPGATTCTIHDLDPANGTMTSFAVLDHDDVPFVDGVYFDPSGTYLFMANRGGEARHQLPDDPAPSGRQRLDERTAASRAVRPGDLRARRRRVSRGEPRSSSSPTTRSRAR